jgi:hypothetical protein
MTLLVGARLESLCKLIQKFAAIYIDQSVGLHPAATWVVLSFSDIAQWKKAGETRTTAIV